jgi:hypothetical protein
MFVALKGPLIGHISAFRLEIVIVHVCHHCLCFPCECILGNGWRFFHSHTPYSPL